MWILFFSGSNFPSLPRIRIVQHNSCFGNLDLFGTKVCLAADTGAAADLDEAALETWVLPVGLEPRLKHTLTCRGLLWIGLNHS